MPDLTELVPIEPMAPAAVHAAGIMFVNTTGETLLLRRGNGGDFPGTWAFPAGGIEPRESPDEAALREVREEVGHSHEGALESLCQFSGFTTFIARGVEKFPVALNDESTGYVWCRPEEAPQPLHPGVPAVLRIAAANTELDIAELMRDGLLPSPQQFGNLWMFALRITGTGMSYRSKIDEHVFRDPALFASERFVQRCNGLSVVWEHPESGLLDSDTFGSSVIGSIMLPYLVGNEVWGIARVIDSVAAEKMRSVQLSTSPGVSHTTQSEGDKVTLDGTDILLEGVPVLLDHLAVCELGVWDKGGPPVGVKLDQEVQDMPNPVKTDDAAAGGNPTPAAPDTAALLTGIGAAIAAAMQPMMARLDSMEKNMPAPPLKTATDSTEEDEKKARADAEEKEEADKKAKADAEEMEAKAKADAEEKAKMDSIKADEDSGMFADAQAKCDSVAQLYNQQAGRQLVGETLLAYRVRQVKPFQQHSKQWKDVNLSAITDSAIFANVEAAIYADAIAAARTYTGGRPGLREIRKVDRATGRTTIEFAGPDGEWMKPFAAPIRRMSAPITK